MGHNMRCLRECPDPALLQVQRQRLHCVPDRGGAKERPGIPTPAAPAQEAASAKECGLNSDKRPCVKCSAAAAAAFRLAGELQSRRTSKCR